MFSKTKFVSTLKCIFLRRYGIYKVDLIENIYFAYRLYGYIHAWIRIYFRSFRSFRIHGASSPCCVLVVVFIRKNVYFSSPILGPVQGPVHVLYYAHSICHQQFVCLGKIWTQFNTLQDEILEKSLQLDVIVFLLPVVTTPILFWTLFHNCAGRNNSLFILTVNSARIVFRSVSLESHSSLSSMIRVGFTRNAGCGVRVTTACECCTKFYSSLESYLPWRMYHAIYGAYFNS